MGAVHGVYLKYVLFSSISMAGCVYLLQSDTGNADKGRMLLRTSPLSNGNIFFAQILGYSAVVNGTVAAVSNVARITLLLS